MLIRDRAIAIKEAKGDNQLVRSLARYLSWCTVQVFSSLLRRVYFVDFEYIGAFLCCVYVLLEIFRSN